MLRRDVEKVRHLEQEKDRIEQNLSRITTERDRLTSELKEMVKKVKEAELKQTSKLIKDENMIDWKVINSCLIQYLRNDTSEDVKEQILKTMSSMLAFTNDEKRLVGLTVMEEESKAISNSFLDFLYESN